MNGCSCARERGIEKGSRGRIGASSQNLPHLLFCILILFFFRLRFEFFSRGLGEGKEWKEGRKKRERISRARLKEQINSASSPLFYHLLVLCMFESSQATTKNCVFRPVETKRESLLFF